MHDSANTEDGGVKVRYGCCYTKHLVLQFCRLFCHASVAERES